MDNVLIGWPGGGWQATARLFGALFFAYVLMLWLASVLWVYRDIRSRSNDIITHLVAVTLAVVFPIAGLPVYLILRPSETLNDSYDRRLEQDALLSELHAMDVCPNCQYPVGEDFTVCANCGTSVRQPCNRCGRALQLQWRHCPYCSAPRPGAQQYPQRAQRTPAEEPRAREEHSDDGGARPAASRQAALDAIRRAAARATAELSPDRQPRPAPEEEPRPATPRARATRPRNTSEDADR